MTMVHQPAAFLVVSVLFLVHQTNGVSTGAVRFYRNGAADLSQTYSSGIVQIYYSLQWGNICDNLGFGQNEADVLCHQFAYSGASSYSNTGLTGTYGTDAANTVMDNIHCSTPNYLTITQCSFDTGSTISSTCNDSTDVIVECYTTRIWNIPFTGDIRLTGGTYSNQGLLEVYCNREWGTVCDDNFGVAEATVACRQLGYNTYNSYDHLSLEGTDNQKIWLRYFKVCNYFSSSCLTECGGCPSSGVTVCSHTEDVTLECEYTSSEFTGKVYTDITDICIYYDYSSTAISSVAIGIIAGSACLFLCCVFLFTSIPVCIVGIVLCKTSRGSPRKQVVTTQAADTSGLLAGEEKVQQGGYPPQPTPVGPSQPQQPPPDYQSQPAAGVPDPDYSSQPDSAGLQTGYLPYPQN